MLASVARSSGTALSLRVLAAGSATRSAAAAFSTFDNQPMGGLKGYSEKERAVEVRCCSLPDTGFTPPCLLGFPLPREGLNSEWAERQKYEGIQYCFASSTSPLFTSCYLFGYRLWKCACMQLVSQVQSREFSSRVTG